MNKKQLRQVMKKKMEELPKGTYRTLCSNITERLTELPEWKEAGIIGITLSMKHEINTEPVIQQAWAANKKVASPKSDPKEKSMDFRLLNSFEDVEEAFAGIREPVLARTKPVAPHDIDLLVVPGLLFDERGYRIGFGGGFYDRFLLKYQGPTVSLAFEMQMVNSLPVESFDRPVDLIITDQRIIRTVSNT
ncbi:MAG TPA: 5-formyltetrahydrofolate cyclo-ligase [Bacillales bacterium]|nr:5-formyltetrahydrofolate cyclo-ligase [Bacillales bacterium]